MEWQKCKFLSISVYFFAKLKTKMTFFFFFVSEVILDVVIFMIVE